MSKFDRIHLVVMDSVGIGAAPDADEFFNHDVDDTKSDTFGHISENFKLEVPNLASIGLGHIPRETPLVGVEKVSKQTGYVTKLEEISRGKDTMTGHWEMMGVVSEAPMPTSLTPPVPAANSPSSPRSSFSISARAAA